MRMTHLRSATLVVGAILAGAGCAPGTDSPEPETVTTVPTLEVAAALGMQNARMPIPGMLTGAQPTREQFDGLSQAGYLHFISLRPTEEAGAGWEEAFSAEAGYAFERLPIEGAASLTRENVERFAAMLEATGDEETVVYCASGNRVGAMLALKAYWMDGASAEDALDLGLDAGMTRLTDPVRELLGLAPEEL